MNINYLGLIDGLETWEVLDEDGNRIGLNQTMPEDQNIPTSVSARQIRLWLIRNGISLSSVDTAINNIPDNLVRESVRVEWEYAPYVERNHPMLVPLALSLGLTEQQIDQAFREASLI